MKKLLPRIILIAVFLFLCVVIFDFLHFMDSPEARYASLRCIYDTLYKSEGTPDVLVLGTSRGVRGIDPEVLANEIALQANDNSDEEPIVINLSRAKYGIGHMYRILLDTVESLGAPEIVLIEYSPTIEKTDSPLFYYGYYPEYAPGVTFGDIIQDWNSKPNEPLDSRLRDVVAGFIRKVDVNLEYYLLNRWRTPSGKLRPLESTWCARGNTPTKTRQLNKLKSEIDDEYGGWEYTPEASWDTDHIDEDRQKYYIDLIQQLGEEHGFQVLFYRMPSYLENIVSPEFINQFEEDFGLPLITPPVNVLSDIYSVTGHANEGHLNKKGVEIYDAWLASIVNNFTDQTEQPES